MADGIIHGIIDCPDCGSEHVIEVEQDWKFERGFETEWYGMRCAECGARWTAICYNGEWFIEGDYDEEV